MATPAATIAQIEMASEEPDVVIGCVGSGSNFAALNVPVDAAQDAHEPVASTPRFLAVEPTACPTLTKGI